MRGAVCLRDGHLGHCTHALRTVSKFVCVGGLFSWAGSVLTCGTNHDHGYRFYAGARDELRRPMVPAIGSEAGSVKPAPRTRRLFMLSRFSARNNRSFLTGYLALNPEFSPRPKPTNRLVPGRPIEPVPKFGDYLGGGFAD